MLILSAILLMLLVFGNYYLSRNIMQPGFIYSLIWLFQILGLILFNDRFLESSAAALFVVVFGAIMFSIGSHIRLLSLNSQNISKISLIKGEVFVVFGVIGFLVTISFYGQYSIFNERAQGLDFGARLMYIRWLISIENEDVYGIYKYGNSIALAALVFLQLLIINNKANKLHKLAFFYFLIISLAMGMLSTGRSSIAFVLLIVGIVYLLKVGITMKVLTVFLMSFSAIFVVFWIMGNSMGKGDEGAGGAVNDLILYLFSSIPVLSVYIDENQVGLLGGEGGINTFRFFAALHVAIFGGDRLPNLVQEFVSVPHRANLYTTYLQYLQDFGYIGAYFISFILGVFHGSLFRSAMADKNNDLLIYLLTLSYLPLIQTVFQETHFTSLSIWIQYLLLGLVIYGVQRKIKFKKSI